MRWLALLALLLPGLASAQEPAYEILSTSGVELRPSLYGDFNARFRQRLAVQTEWRDGWRFQGDAALRVRPAPLDTSQLDFYRLNFAHAGQSHRLTLGRQTRHDPRGFQRIDGMNVDVDAGTAVAGSVYAGRLWFPSHFDSEVGTLVLGGQLTLRPMEEGRASRRTRFVVGFEGRALETQLTQRVLASASTFGPRGGRGLVMVEVEPGPDDVRTRATVSGGVPVGAKLDLGLDLRWEDLRNPSAPASLQSPIDWLAPDGYGIGQATLSWRSGGLNLVVRGGPSLRPGAGEATLGGLGRADLGYRLGGLQAGVYANAAGIGGSWVAGGGAVAGLQANATSFTADIGLYRIQGIDGAQARVWEGRVRGRTPLYRASEAPDATRVDLSFWFDGGADRQLRPWAKATAVLDVRTGGRR